MDFHVSDDLPRNRRQMSLGLCRHKFVVVHLGFVGFFSHCCNHHSHHFGYHVDAFVGGLLIEIGDAIAVAEIEIHPDAYDAGAVVGLVVDGAAVGVDDAAGVDAVDVGGAAAVDAAVDVGEIVVVVAFDADVASEHASSFAVASYAVVVAAAVGVVAAAVVAFDVGLAVNALFVVVDLVVPSFDVQVLQLS